MQVRSQAFVNAAELREAVRQAAKWEEKRRRAAARAEAEAKCAAQREQLQAECDRATLAVGQAQREALEQPDPRIEREEAAQRDAAAAKARFDVAFTKQRRDAAARDEAASTTLKTRAIALNVERARAAAVAALPPPSPPPYEEPMAAARSVTIGQF